MPLTVENLPANKNPYLCGVGKSYLKYYDRFVLLAWVCILLLFWWQYDSALNTWQSFLLSACCFGSAYPFTTFLSKTLLSKAVEKLGLLKFALQFFMICLLFSFFIPLTGFLFYHLEHHSAFPDMRYFETGKALNDYIAAIFISFILNFGFCGLRFFEINLKMQAELSDSQMQILQAQISPHFMFNVLNHVHVLIRREPELADALLLQYTDILRYQLYSGKKDKIAVSQEVRFLKNFVDVEAIRWKNKLDIDCRWETENPAMEIPPLLLITFVENAFKHVSRSGTERGYVNINFRQKDETVYFKVENANSNFTPSKKDDSGIGLANIKRRLDILFPRKHSLEISCNETYYSVKLTLKQ
ncbi:MAG: histidine kinase [Tannerellaceae bacterium]|nr:histidine kinase [Tannerellaceae bacterium]